MWTYQSQILNFEKLIRKVENMTYVSILFNISPAKLDSFCLLKSMTRQKFVWL